MKQNTASRRFVAMLLRFTRDEQKGFIPLFLLVLAAIFVPRFMLPPDPGPLSFEALKNHIDSLEQFGDPPLVMAESIRGDYAKPVLPGGSRKADTNRISINYKPFVRPEPVEVILDLNTADTTELQQIRGIGSYFARRIVDYRTRLGGYVHIGQLMEIKGIDEEKVLRWQKQLKVNPATVERMDLSTVSEEQLRRHPYIGYYTARGIISFRKTQPEVTLDALVKNNILASDIADRLRKYVVN